MGITSASFASRPRPRHFMVSLDSNFKELFMIKIISLAFIFLTSSAFAQAPTSFKQGKKIASKAWGKSGKTFYSSTAAKNRGLFFEAVNALMPAVA